MITKRDTIEVCRDLDKRMDEVTNWIKHYYSNYNPRPNSAMDLQAMELGKQLDKYYWLRCEKDRLMYELNKGEIS